MLKKMLPFLALAILLFSTLVTPISVNAAQTQDPQIVDDFKVLSSTENSIKVEFEFNEELITMEKTVIGNVNRVEIGSDVAEYNSSTGVLTLNDEILNEESTNEVLELASTVGEIVDIPNKIENEITPFVNIDFEGGTQWAFSGQANGYFNKLSVAGVVLAAILAAVPGVGKAAAVATTLVAGFLSTITFDGLTVYFKVTFYKHKTDFATYQLNVFFYSDSARTRTLGNALQFLAYP